MSVFVSEAHRARYYRHRWHRMTPEPGYDLAWRCQHCGMLRRARMSIGHEILRDGIWRIVGRGPIRFGLCEGA